MFPADSDGSVSRHFLPEACDRVWRVSSWLDLFPPSSCFLTCVWCSACDTPLGAAALYTLLHGNPAFMEYVLAVTDIEALVCPLLEQLYVVCVTAPRLCVTRLLTCGVVSLCRYAVEHMKPGLRYIISIILLLLTQSRSFSENVHKRVVRVFLMSSPWLASTMTAVWLCCRFSRRFLGSGSEF